MNGSFPFIDKYIADTQTNIDKGLDKEPGGIDPMYYYIGGGALVVILILVVAYRKIFRHQQQRIRFAGNIYGRRHGN